MPDRLTPAGVCPPPANYSHGTLVQPHATWLFASGQLGVRPDGTIPTSAAEQTEHAFQNVQRVLESGGMSMADIVRLNAYLVDPGDLSTYMRIRDRYVVAPPPASTLVVVRALARPAFKVEVEVVAARPDPITPARRRLLRGVARGRLRGSRRRGSMRLGSFAFAALVGLGGAALADTGDALRVTGQGVNVRSGPSTDFRVVLQVNRNREAIELERQGEWIRVDIDGPGGRSGWIHGSLLEPVETAATPSTADAAPPATAQRPEPAASAPEVAAAEEEPAGDEPNGSGGPVPAAGRPPEPAAGPSSAALSGSIAGVERFRDNVDYLNKRARQVAGVDLFTDVSMVDGGVVQIGTTEAWGSVPPAGQRSYLNTLYDRWVAAQDGRTGVSVQILDGSGSVMMEKSEP